MAAHSSMADMTAPPDVSPIRGGGGHGGGVGGPASSASSPPPLGGPSLTSQAGGNLGALIAKVSVLQQQAQEIENDKRRLSEQCEFAAAEKTRGQSLLEAAQAELKEVHARVRQLVVARDEHVCSASDQSYRGLEQRTKEARAVRMRVARKQEHLDAVLGATRAVAAQVQHLRMTDVTALTTATDFASVSDANADADDDGGAGAYIRTLLQKTGEQAVALDRLRRAADSRDKLEEESEANDAKIRELRAALEEAGAPVPEAPQMHRTKRLIARASKNAAAIEEAAALDASNNNNNNTSSSVSAAMYRADGNSSIGGAQFNGLNASEHHYTSNNVNSSSSSTAGVGGSGYSRSSNSNNRCATRRIELPVGTLRSVAQRAGYATMRDAAKAFGVANMAVQVTQTTTELHCSGAMAALDGFHAALLAALESEAAFKHIDGIVTASDRDVALTVRDTVHELADAVPVQPERAALGETAAAAVLDDAVRRRVQFGVDGDDENMTVSDGTSTTMAGDGAGGFLPL